MHITLHSGFGFRRARYNYAKLPLLHLRETSDADGLGEGL